jgi:hypothetical protein
MRGKRLSRGAAGALAVVAGVVVGTVLSGFSLVAHGLGPGPSGTLRAGSPTAVGAPQARLDLLHTPPLLVLRGEIVELRYELVCPTSETGCAPEGTAYLRAGSDAGFTALRLRPGGPARQDRWYVRVPGRFLEGSSFSYYVVMRDRASGLQMTLPAGGANGPQRAWVLDRPHVTDLGTHRFGQPRPPDAVAARAPWGDGATALGLDTGREQATVGPSSFDVGTDGSVRILDQVNRRLATFRPDRAAQPARVVPLAISGAMADLATAVDGTAYVLDQGRDRPATVRAFDPSGRVLGSAALPSGTSADQLRVSPNGLVAHQYPDEVWLPAGAPGGHPMSTAERAAAAHAGCPVALPPGADPSKRRAGDSGEVVIRALPHEARVALVRGTTVLAAWRLRSSTDLGEIGLAEPFGNGLVVVVRVWTETRAEQQVIRLGSRGVDSTFAVDRAEWAQALPSSRFRLGQDGRLYQLRSSPSGVQVARWGIGGRR